MCLVVVIRCVTSCPEILVLCLPPFFLIRAPIFALKFRARSEFGQCLVHSGVGRKAASDAQDDLLTMRLVEFPTQGYHAVVKCTCHACNWLGRRLSKKQNGRWRQRNIFVVGIFLPVGCRPSRLNARQHFLAFLECETFLRKTRMMQRALQRASSQ